MHASPLSLAWTTSPGDLFDDRPNQTITCDKLSALTMHCSQTRLSGGIDERNAAEVQLNSRLAQASDSGFPALVQFHRPRAFQSPFEPEREYPRTILGCDS